MAQQVSIQDDIKRLRETYQNITGKQLAKAISRAMNHSLAKAKTQAKREITSIYNIPSALASESMRVTRANTVTLTGSLDASSHYTPLHFFRPTQTTSVISETGFSKNISVTRTRRGEMRQRKAGKRAKMGLAVTIIKGQRTSIASAFYVHGKYIAARGDYNNSQQFQFRKHRTNRSGNDTPISSIKTLSVFKSAINNTVQKRLSEHVMRDYSTRVIHEITRGLEYGNR